MKYFTSFLFMITSAIFSASGQTSTGVLKIFSDSPLVVYIDETHYPQYGEIKLVSGTHWVKAINGEGIKVYSQIVTVKANEVTSLLIEAPQAQTLQSRTGLQQAVPAQTPGSGQSIIYGQAVANSGAEQSAGNEQASAAPGNAPAEAAVVATPKPTIDIGQVGGRLPQI